LSIYEWCTARQLLYCTYLRSLVYACTYIYRYGISKILLSLKKCHATLIMNVAIQDLFVSLDLVSFWCHVSPILCVTITKKVFSICANSFLDTSWGNHEIWHQCVQWTRMRLSNTSSSYSRSMSSVWRDSRSVNELSAYEFSTYGTRHGGSILASIHLNTISILMFFYRFSLTSSRSFIQKDYLETTTIVPLIDQIVLSTHLTR